MAALRFDQVNIIVGDVAGSARFLRALGSEVDEFAPEWVEWESHHVGLHAADQGFTADLDGPAFASHWGGLPEGFTGVVVNLRTDDRPAVDATFARALELGAEALRAPYDAFWGARYAVVLGPGPLVVGLMSPVDPAARSAGPAVSDFT